MSRRRIRSAEYRARRYAHKAERRARRGLIPAANIGASPGGRESAVVGNQPGVSAGRVTKKGAETCSPPAHNAGQAL